MVSNKTNNNQGNLISKNIENLEPGMKIAKDVEYDFGGVLISEGTILDEEKINRLKKINMNIVSVHDQEQSQIEENLDKIEKIHVEYKSHKNNIKSIFQKIKTNEEVEYKKVKELSHEITSLGNEDEMIDLLTTMREADEYTYSHLLNVGMLAYMFSQWLDLDEEESIKLTQAGLLHDIGKAHVPDEILNKPGKLNDEEFSEIKKHSNYGYQMAKENKDVPDKVAQGILTHHEKFNGEGYPLGIKSRKIPFFGRILAIVDTFDAITSNRVYQSSSSPFRAIELFRKETFGAFDYKLLKIFLDKIPKYFVNKEVELTDGRKAKVVFINPRKPHRPILNIKGEYIDLYNNPELDIGNLVK